MLYTCATGPCVGARSVSRVGAHEVLAPSPPSSGTRGGAQATRVENTDRGCSKSTLGGTQYVPPEDV